MGAVGKQRPLHVERTAEPTTLRWVCHDQRLTAGRLQPGGGSEADGKLAEMVSAGALSVVRAEVGSLLISATEWTHGLIDSTTAAVRCDLDEGRLAWVRPIELTVEQVADYIAREIGSVLDLHGGSVTVRNVTRLDGVTEVAVELGGACHGCAGATETIHGRALDALRRIDPDVRMTVVSGGNDASAGDVFHAGRGAGGSQPVRLQSVVQR